MIYAWTGKTGSGKTSEMIFAGYKYWKKGIDIYSNTILFYEKYGGKAGSNIIDNPKEFSKKEHVWWRIKYLVLRIWVKITKKEREIFCPTRGRINYFEDISEILEVRDGLIMFDEGQELFEARSWESLPTEFSNKLRQHRKHSLDLFTTTQNIGTIDKNYRRLVQGWWHVEDIFALFGIRNPNLFSLHRSNMKDIDELYGNPEDLAVETIKSKLFIINRWKPRLYDTLFDIGFKRFKIVWLEDMNQITTKQKAKICLIIPKTWTLSHARQHLSLQKYYLEIETGWQKNIPIKTDRGDITCLIISDILLRNEQIDDFRIALNDLALEYYNKEYTEIENMKIKLESICNIMQKMD